LKEFSKREKDSENNKVIASILSVYFCFSIVFAQSEYLSFFQVENEIKISKEMTEPKAKDRRIS